MIDLLTKAPLIAGGFLLTYALLVAVLVRLVGSLARPGWHADEGRTGWALWFSEALMAGARGVLRPLYLSVFTRPWLRLAGIKIGKRAEVSTVVGLNRMSSFARGELCDRRRRVRRCTRPWRLAARRADRGRERDIPRQQRDPPRRHQAWIGWPGRRAHSRSAKHRRREEAARRLAARPQSSGRRRTSRSYASIVRANVLTVFNLDPRRLRRGDADLRRLARRAVPRGDRRELGDRDHAGGAREARARPALAARRAPRARCVRDGAVSAGPGRGGRRRATSCCSHPGDQVVADGRVLVASELRVDESILSGESEPARAGAGRGGALGRVRRGGHGRLRGHGRRRRQLRGAPDGRGALLPPSALAARARGQPAAVRAGRARDRARRRCSATRSTTATCPCTRRSPPPRRAS